MTMTSSSEKTAHLFRAGDTIRHEPSGETWLLACDEDRGMVVACGWPESFVPSSDCILVEAATDEYRLDLLHKVAASRGDHGEGSARSRLAQRQLEAER
jgi:hypothetical protein